jgi:hypothetical protein
MALVATASAVGSAAAQTPVSFISQNPTLGYEGTVVGCETGTADGTLDADGSYELALGFFDCNAGTLEVDVECEGTVSLIPQNPMTSMGTVQLNDGFGCDIVTALCTFSFDGPQDTGDGNVLFGDGTFTVDVAMAGSRTGAEICGPAEGTASWAGSYEEVP